MGKLTQEERELLTAVERGEWRSVKNLEVDGRPREYVRSGAGQLAALFDQRISVLTALSSPGTMKP